jgi:hypothetical protein
MINLPKCNENMRHKLNIPLDAIVFGRYGGYNQFDIEYVQKIVYNIAKNNNNIYFLFVNTKPFCENLKNIIHLPCIIDLNEKTKFINSCDAMIWGRSDGEVFSLSQGEFCFKNKPIICSKFQVFISVPNYNSFISSVNGNRIYFTINSKNALFTKFFPNLLVTPLDPAAKTIGIRPEGQLYNDRRQTILEKGKQQRSNLQT